MKEGFAMENEIIGIERFGFEGKEDGKHVDMVRMYIVTTGISKKDLEGDMTSSCTLSGKHDDLHLGLVELQYVQGAKGARLVGAVNVDA